MSLGSHRVMLGLLLLALTPGCGKDADPNIPVEEGLNCLTTWTVYGFQQIVDDEPVWCPADDNLIAYRHTALTYDDAREHGITQLWLLDLENSECTYLTAGWHPEWRNDGAALCFSDQGVNGVGQVWIYWMTTGVREEITDGRASKSYPCWIPNTNRIVFGTAGPDGDRPAGLWEVTLGGESRFLRSGFGPDVSSDGRRVAFGSGLSVAGIDSGGQVMVLPEPGITVNEWAQSDERIGFVLFTEDGLTVQSIMADGSDRRLMVRGASGVTFSGDGQWIAFSRIDEDEDVALLFRSRLDGSMCEQLTWLSSYGDSLELDRTALKEANQTRMKWLEREGLAGYEHPGE